MSSLLQAITPTNLHEEREKFLESTDYNPIFKYKWQGEEPITITSEGLLSQGFLDSIINQDIAEMTKYAQALFLVSIDPDILQSALSILKTKPEKLKRPDIKQISEAFDQAIRFFELDYDVVVSKRDGFFFRPNHKKLRLVISQHAELRFFSIDGAVKHEMTHILRQINTLYNQVPPVHNFLMTEEGLASFMQDHYGEDGHLSEFQHAAEYVATDIGLNASLRDIYEFFRSIGFTKTLAWQRAARHKFGFVDTSQPGDIMKPAMYYHYEQKVKALPENERWHLFVGKISIDDLSNYTEYKGQVPLDRLKTFFETKW